MSDVPMTVLSSEIAAGKGILVYTGDGTVVMRGNSTGANATCGACGVRLIEGMSLSDFRQTMMNAALRCPACTAVNA